MAGMETEIRKRRLDWKGHFIIEDYKRISKQITGQIRGDKSYIINPKHILRIP